MSDVTHSDRRLRLLAAAAALLIGAAVLLLDQILPPAARGALGIVCNQSHHFGQGYWHCGFARRLAHSRFDFKRFVCIKHGQTPHSGQNQR